MGAAPGNAEPPRGLRSGPGPQSPRWKPGRPRPPMPGCRWNVPSRVQLDRPSRSGAGPPAGSPSLRKPSTGGRRSGRERPGAPSPDLRPHVRLSAHDDVHHRPVEEVGGGVDLLAHPAPVEVPPLVELLLEHVEEVVLLDALDDLLLVVEREIGCNRPCEPVSYTHLR